MMIPISPMPLNNNILEIEKIFDDIASKALRHITIDRENDEGDLERFFLAEIEIYLIDPSKGINDLFIHKNKAQKKKAGEYVHYSGFDICRGNNDNVYCGVLVRGLMNEHKTIFGPRRVKFKGKAKEKREIIINDNKNADRKVLFLEKRADEPLKLENIILKLPRVNLSNSKSYENLSGNSDQLNMYLNLKARYLVLRDMDLLKSVKSAPEERREIYNALMQAKPNIPIV